MTAKKHIATDLRQQELFPGLDLAYTYEAQGIESAVYVTIWWHRPSLNQSWYPLVQVDYGRKTMYGREGPENPEAWRAWLWDIARFIETH